MRIPIHDMDKDALRALQVREQPTPSASDRVLRQTPPVFFSENSFLTRFSDTIFSTLFQVSPHSAGSSTSMASGRSDGASVGVVRHSSPLFFFTFRVSLVLVLQAPLRSSRPSSLRSIHPPPPPPFLATLCTLFIHFHICKLASYVIGCKRSL